LSMQTLNTQLFAQICFNRSKKRNMQLYCAFLIPEARKSS
jgi:hypothetical protein